MNEPGRALWRIALPALTAVALVTGLLLVFRSLAPAEDGPRSLLVCCGAGLRPPVQEAIEFFERRSGVRVEADYGAANLLLGRIKLSGRGDVFVPGDAFYVAEARREGIVVEERPVASFEPVIMVARGNPKGVREVADLAAPGLRVGLVDERTAAMGRITPELLRRNAVPQDDVRRNTVLDTVTVTELAQAVALGHVDAGLVWRPVALQYPDAAEIVEIPPDRNVRSPVSAATLTTAAHPDAASAFVAFLAGPMGRECFRRHRYAPPQEHEPRQASLPAD
ncbi:MAG: solute-binding protein [Candidatus Brocadiaceae bacterium]|nr:solute-binding protein [Candidatus Brocadiaceae bacterium]